MKKSIIAIFLCLAANSAFAGFVATEIVNPSATQSSIKLDFSAFSSESNLFDFVMTNSDFDVMKAKHPNLLKLENNKLASKIAETLLVIHKRELLSKESHDIVVFTSDSVFKAQNAYLVEKALKDEKSLSLKKQITNPNLIVNYFGFRKKSEFKLTPSVQTYTLSGSSKIIDFFDFSESILSKF